MTVDDDSSIYVGGLPYDCSEEDLHHAFEFFGSVVAVKIINDREVGGKCYGFVTFKNPRSAADAINEMDGKQIKGRVVKVNEVRTRGGRPHFARENFRRDFGRDMEWGRGRDREREYNRERERYRDHSDNHSPDHDRDRGRNYERGLDDDRFRERSLDRDRDRDYHTQYEARSRDRGWEKDDDMDWNDDGEAHRRNEYTKSKDNESDRQIGKPRSDKLHERDSRDLSSSSSDEYDDNVKEQIKKSLDRLEDIQKEVNDLQEKVDDKEELVLELGKKYQKVEEALAAARKLSSQQRSKMAELVNSFRQVQDCSEKLEKSKQELKTLVEETKVDIDGDVDGIEDSLE